MKGDFSIEDFWLMVDGGVYGNKNWFVYQILTLEPDDDLYEE